MVESRTARAAEGQNSYGNRLLEVFLRESPAMQATLQPVWHPAGHGIYRQDRPISHAYFPVTGVMALGVTLRDGSGCQAIAVGSEGLVGLPLYFGLSFSSYTVTQQAEGRSYRVAAPIFLEVIRRSAPVQTLMQRYCEFSQRFTHQTAACNTLHSTKQRACRWLLVMRDRAGTDEFALPQALLAEMLGVRRQSISEVAAELRRKGLIEYRRGRITIANRRKLEAVACCECYGIMNGYYDRLISRIA